MMIKVRMGALAQAGFVMSMLAGVASPALAEAQTVSPTPVTLASGKPSTQGAEKKICTSEMKGASRIPRKICRTPEEWALEQQSRHEKGLATYQPN
jgi:invasion protein IalB